MWLLDKNVPIQLVGLLADVGIDAVLADAKGWGALKNGELVAAAATDGISCILTRDRLFAESAGRVAQAARGPVDCSPHFEAVARSGIPEGVR
jgi:predicted nuclease of predicted toxin-antitoxin system